MITVVRLASSAGGARTPALTPAGWRQRARTLRAGASAQWSLGSVQPGGGTSMASQ